MSVAHRNVWRPCKYAYGHHLLTWSEIKPYWRRHWRAWRRDAEEVLYLLPADGLPQPSGGRAVADTSCCKIGRGPVATAVTLSHSSVAESMPLNRRTCCQVAGVSPLDSHARPQVAIAACQNTDVSDDMKVSSNYGVDGQTSISRSRPCSAI